MERNLAQLFNPVEKIVGIEIAQGAVRAVLLEKDKKGAVRALKRAASMPPDIVHNGELQKKDELVAVLKQFREANKDLFRSRYVILALPSASAFVDRIEFPNIVPEQIEESVKLNIGTKSLFPVEAAEIYYDWQPATARDVYHREALIVFAMRDSVSAYLAACEQAGLEPLAFEVPSLSIARALLNFSDKAGIVIRLLDEGVECSVVRASELRFCRFVPTPHIASIEEFKQFAKNEMASVLRFYEIENPHEPVSGAVMLSYFTQKNELVTYLSAELSLAFQQPRFTHDIAVEDASAGAYGAALRGLIPREEDTFISVMPVGTEEMYRVRRFRAYTALWADIINATAVLLVALYATAWFFLNMTDRTVSAQTSQLKTSSPATEEIAQIEAEAGRANAAIAHIVATEHNMHRWSRTLETIVPPLTRDGITIQGITMPSPEGEFSLSIIAATRDTAIAFRKTLEQNQLFASVQFPFLGVEQKENIQLSVRLTLAPPTP